MHGDAVVFHFVTFLPCATDPDLIVELHGLKPRPVMHRVGAEEEEGGDSSSFLHKAVRVVKKEFLAKFDDPEAAQMNVLALTSGAVGLE